MSYLDEAFMRDNLPYFVQEKEEEDETDNGAIV